MGVISLCLEILYIVSLSLCCVFDSESTLKGQLDKEKAALQQSIHKNSALISEKDRQMENLKGEVRI